MFDAGIASSTPSFDGYSSSSAARVDTTAMIPIPIPAMYNKLLLPIFMQQF
jgi:hypothetical protein